MMDLSRVSDDIVNVGLYDWLYQEMSRAAGHGLSPRETESLLRENPLYLEEYREINRENNISNIHLKSLALEGLGPPEREMAKGINENLERLKRLEKYTLDFEKSPVLMALFSVEFFLLFSVQYLIVLMDLKEWQWWIYGVFASSLLVSFFYAKRMRRLYRSRNEEFRTLYKRTEETLRTFSLKISC